VKQIYVYFTLTYCTVCISSEQFRECRNKKQISFWSHSHVSAPHIRPSGYDEIVNSKKATIALIEIELRSNLWITSSHGGDGDRVFASFSHIFTDFRQSWWERIGRQCKAIQVNRSDIITWIFWTLAIYIPVRFSLSYSLWIP